METGTAAAICLIGAIAATLLKQYHKEQALLCSIGVCVIVLLAILSYLSPIAETIQFAGILFIGNLEGIGRVLPDQSGSGFMPGLRRDGIGRDS